jgi:hypothetical protein
VSLVLALAEKINVVVVVVVQCYEKSESEKDLLCGICIKIEKKNCLEGGKSLES